MILSPTRELAQQSARVLMALGQHLKVTVHICTGGTKVAEDKRILQEGVQIVVGTPGRIFDMMKREYLKADKIKVLVLDEADQMLDQGFKEQIGEIFKLLPPDIQCALFSATMPDTVLKLTEDFMRNPAIILVKNDELTLDGIKQFFIPIEKEEWKFDTLKELYNAIEIQQAIIYCNKKQRVEEITGRMKENGFTVSFMHGEMQ